MKKSALFLLSGAILLSSCTSDIGTNVYDVSNANTVSQVAPCTVVSVRPVTVRASDSGNGTALGAIAGGVAGSQIGSGSEAGVLGALGGALIGGVAGTIAEDELSTQSALEYIVQLQNGTLQTVTQGTDVWLQAGQNCFLVYGSHARVIPAN